MVSWSQSIDLFLRLPYDLLLRQCYTLSSLDLPQLE